MPRAERFAPVVLGIAMALAAAYLLWEGRGLTFFVDEWSFGYGDRPGFAPSELLSPDNGHLAVVPILLQKASMGLFGAETALPLRLVSAALHLTTALLAYVLLRRSLGDLVALAPAVLLLFLGAAADLFVGSHGIPMLIACASGLGAWIALDARTRAGDALAAALLVAGIASNGLALLFVVGAAVALHAAGRQRRLWVVALPLALYLLWRLAYGGGDEGGFSLANAGGLPAFAFDSLGAELGALSGLFTATGARGQSFDPLPGLALAGALCVGLGGLWIHGWRPPRAALPVVAALLALWVLTGLSAGPPRQPTSSRYLYPGAILVLLLAAQLLASSPWRRRAGLALAAVCLLGLLPNLREVHYFGNFFREQSDQDRAVLAAADGLGAEAPADLLLELDGDPAGVGVADMGFTLGVYREARARYGSPAFSAAALLSAPASAQAAAARLRQRAGEG